MSHPFESVDVVGDAAMVRLVKERHDTVALAFVTQQINASLVVNSGDPVAQLRRRTVFSRKVGVVGGGGSSQFRRRR